MHLLSEKLSHLLDEGEAAGNHSGFISAGIHGLGADAVDRLAIAFFNAHSSHLERANDSNLAECQPS